MKTGTPTLDLRTDRPEGLDIGKSFTAKRGSGWNWNGVERWWEVETTVTGYNGAGGYWVTENWHWNGSPQFLRNEIRSLTAEQSRALDDAYLAAQSQIKGQS